MSEARWRSEFEACRAHVVVDVERAREVVHLVVDGVLDVALLALEGDLHGLEVVALLRRGDLRLDARLQAALGLAHEVVAHVLPRVEVGGRRGDGHVRQVAHLDLRTGGEGVGSVG